MARTAGSDGEKTQAAIRDAALDLIARHGYEAMSMRRLAAEVGVQVAALYRYFPTKEELLFSLMREHMEGLLESWRAARPASADPVFQLAAFVRNHIAFHIARRHSTHVSNMELRALSHDRILREGADNGDFAVDDVALTAMAIIQMTTGVIVWFRPDERLSVREVADTYHAMTMRLVGARGRSEDDREEDIHVRSGHELRAW
jgi:AcrR family transcriptional regulator